MTNISTLRIRKILSLSRFSSFDTSTEEGRANERHRRIFLTAVASVFAKVVSMATMFISIPLTLQYLGIERFGLWMTISSVIAMLAFADLGIGNGLLNAISEANGKDDHASVRRYISSAFVILTGIALFISLTFSLITPHVPWARLFNVQSPLAIKESGVAVAVFVFCFAINIPAGIIQRVQMGLQMGFIANLWQAGGSILGLVAVLLVIKFEMGLPWLVGAMAGAPVLAALLNGILFFGLTRTNLAPDFGFVCLAAMKRIAHIGSLFLVLQVAGLIAFQSDVLILAHYLGPEAVAQYSIVMKAFSIPSLILSFYLMALWPAYGEALSRSDMNWVRSSFIKSLKYSFVINIPITIFLVIFGNWLIENWVGPSVSPSLDLLIGMGLWSALTVLGGNFAALLNGLNAMRFQALTAALMAVVNILISIWLVKLIGISGVIYGSIISLIFINYIPLGFFIKKFLYEIK
jgi:O-antigen/teichoic acid export membrane protein